MKKLTSLILTFSLLLSIFCGLSFQVASADTLWGIDVSHYQGDINWTKVKAAGVDFVIIQAGYEYTKNQRFEEYYAGAKAAGIPVGAYLYTYADNVDEATREANALLTFLEGKTFEYPIYIDVEESSKYSKYTKDFVANLVLTELEILSAAGYYCGVYTYTNFANNYINMSKLSAYTTWIAEYNSKCNYKGAYDMWQYSSDLSVSGVSSRSRKTSGGRPGPPRDLTVRPRQERDHLQLTKGRPMKFSIPALSVLILASSLLLPGCRREDVREMTVSIPGLAESNKATVVAALAKYGGVQKDSFRWDMKSKTLTLRYDSMQVAQANIRYAIAEKGLDTVIPTNTTGRAGY